MTTREEILKLLKEGPRNQTALAKELNLKKATVAKALQRLVDKGQVRGIGKTLNRYFELVQRDVQSMSKALSKGAIYKEQDVQSLSKQRIHRLKRSIELLAKPSLEGWKEIRLNNNSQYVLDYEGLTLRFTNNLLIVEGLQLIGDYAIPSEHLLLQANDLADAVLRRAQASLSLQLKWGSEKTTIMEHAFTEQEYMKEAKREGERGILTLYENPTTKKMEVWGDLSFNIGELETNQARHAPRLRAFIKPIIEDRWNVEAQLAINQQLLEGQLTFSKNLVEHVEAIRELRKMAKEIRDVLRQRRL